VTALAVAAAGCTSYSTRMDATPVAPGEREVGLAVDLLVVERGRDPIALPSPELSVQRGLRPGVDLVGKLHLTGAELSTRFALRGAAGARLRLAAAGGLALGYQPVSNNTTDLVYARAIPRLIVEYQLAPSGVSLIAAASPSVELTGPLTMFAGVAGAARWILRPGSTLAVELPLSGRRLWLEITAQPAYALGDGWLAPSFQGGAALWF